MTKERIDHMRSVARLVGPSDRTIRRRLKELRKMIDESKDPAEQRIAYAMECAIRWAREKTVDWDAPVITAQEQAITLRKELNV